VHVVPGENACQHQASQEVGGPQDEIPMAAFLPAGLYPVLLATLIVARVYAGLPADDLG
jgi:hypothetical protein